MSLLGCAVIYLPTHQDNIEIQGDTAVLTLESEIVTIAYDTWTVEPQFLANYYTTISVFIQNITKKSIDIKFEDFVLLNENKVQYDQVLPIEVIDMILINPTTTSTIMHQNHNNQNLNINRNERRKGDSRIRNAIQRYDEHRYNILRKSFTFGALHSGARKEGVLYFPKLDSNNQEFTLVYKGNEIVFRKSKNK